MDKDLRFGQIAIQLGYANDNDIEKAVAFQQKIFESSQAVARIGDILVKLGALTHEQRIEVIRKTKAASSGGSRGPGCPEPARGCFGGYNRSDCRSHR